MKKYGLLILILLPWILFAQVAEEETENEGTTFGMGGVVGSITVGDKTYSQIRLMPEISIWKFGFGLDIDLLIDGDGNVRKEDWDEAEDIINKIYYIRFAQRRDPFYFKVGSIPNYTLGHGLIFDSYSNMLQYPVKRNIGGYVGVNTPLSGLGFEVFSHNVKDNEILAGRVFAKPLDVMDIPILSNLKVGVNVGVDRNPFGRYTDEDDNRIPDIYELDSVDLNGNGIIDHPDLNPYVEEVYPGIAGIADSLGWELDNTIIPLRPWSEEEKNVWIYSADYEVPLIDYDYFSLWNYGELAMIKDYGTGFIFPGFGSKFLVFDMNLEFRRFGEEFLPGFFDQLYDEQRAYLAEITDLSGNTIRTVLTKDEILKSIKSSLGWYASIRANIFNVLFMRIAYQDMYGEDVITGKSIWGTLGVDPSIVPKLKEASISYSQSNVRTLAINQLKSPSAQVVGKMSYGLSENTFLVGKYSERYIDIDGNGKIQGSEETVSSMTFGVEFKF